MSPALDRTRDAARRDKRVRFTALLHHVTVDLLRFAAFQLNKAAAPGVNGLTCDANKADLQSSLRDLHARVHRGALSSEAVTAAVHSRADGGKRPLGIAALEDKIVQRAVDALTAPFDGRR